MWLRCVWLAASSERHGNSFFFFLFFVRCFFSLLALRAAGSGVIREAAEGRKEQAARGMRRWD
jgi:hypothetical protein